MNNYIRGTPINLRQKFWRIDALTEVAVLADPTTVVFTVLSPDDDEQVFTFGIDTNVSNPQVGVYVCLLDPQLPTGTYSYRCEGSGAVVAANEDMFEVVASAVLDPDPPTVAQPGPCSSWINGDDVANQGKGVPGIGSDTWLLDQVAFAASDLLYSLSARQFPGVCERTVRPYPEACNCWSNSASLGLGPWAWAWYGGWGGAGWGWYGGNEGGAPFIGCGALSTVRLAGYPVRQILEVKIGGEILPEIDTDTGYPNWRLDGRRNLIRCGSPGPPQQDNFWPACQDMSMPDTVPGTFSIKYTWGADVPLLGRMAAAQLARELWAAENGSACALPTKVTKVVRAGLTLERVVPIAQMLREGSTGLQLVDAFIAAYNPAGLRGRSAVWSPDVQQMARRQGQR